MKRVRKTKDFGNFKEVENVCAPMYGNHSKRNPRIKKTAETAAKQNDRHAAERCEDKIKANFKGGDWFLTLTYDDESNPNNSTAAKKDIQNFFDRLGRKCAKKNITLKYCKTTEQGEKNKRFHHHIILPSEISFEDIEKIWGKGEVFPERLRADKHGRLDVHNLAEYFVGINKKKREKNANKKRYSFSRNCIAPKITYEHLASSNWLKSPRPPKGWYVLPNSIEEYTDGYGINHQRYILARIYGHETNNNGDFAVNRKKQKGKKKSGSKYFDSYV